MVTHDDDAHADLEVIDLAAQVDSLPEKITLVPPGERTSRRSVTGERTRWPLAALIAVVVLTVAWAGVAVVTVLGIRSDVVGTRDVLLQARDVLTDGDVDGAAVLFDDAARALGSLPDRVDSPLVWPVRLIPTYRRSLDAVAELGRAGQQASSAAGQIAESLGDGQGGLGALTPRDGRLPLDAIAALTPVLRAAADDVEDALARAESVPTTGVDDSIVDGRAEFIEILQPTADQLRTGVDITEVLPAMFGAEGPRRYIVMASNPTEARGTGGFFGAYTVMEAIDGEMSFGPVGETLDLPVPPDPSVVEWVDPSLEARWDVYGGSTRVRSINMTPDFPSAATMLERYWSAVMGQDVDGVIAVDPFAFEAMLEINGPIELAEFGEITAEEVVEFVSYSAYALIESPIERKTLIGNVATSSLLGFLEGPEDVTPGQVLDVLGRMAQRDSLLMHSVHPDEQALLEEARLAGKFDGGDGDLLAVVLNSGSGSKIDYFLERSIRYDVTLEDDGSANGIVAAGFVNNAPSSGELTYMIGPPLGVDFSAGENLLLSSVYCAPGCAFFETPDIGYADLPTSQTVELGYPVASTWMLIPSMQARELIYSYSTPTAWEFDGDDMVYSLRYIHQTAVRPTDVEIHLAIPDGMEPAELPESAVVEDDTVIIGFSAQQDTDIRVRLSPI